MISISTYNLTATTKLIMDYLWDFPEGTSFREIYKHFTEVKGRDWKRQTLYTYLTILMEQGFQKAPVAELLISRQFPAMLTVSSMQRRFWRMLMTILL